MMSLEQSMVHNFLAQKVTHLTFWPLAREDEGSVASEEEAVVKKKDTAAHSTTTVNDTRPSAIAVGTGAILVLVAILVSAENATPNSKHWFTTSFRQPLPYLVTRKGPENSANEQFFVGAQTVVSLLQTTQFISIVFLYFL